MKPARSTYRALAAGAVIALAAGIAACGGSDAPAPTPASRPVAEVTDGTTPTPAVVETDEATEPAEPADPADPTEPDEPQWIIDTEQKTPAEGTTGNVTVAGTTVTVGNPDAEKRAHIYMDFVGPHCVTLHELMADDLEECWQLLRQSLTSVSYECLARLDGYSSWLVDVDWVPAYRRHRRNLQLIGANDPDRRWVLKNPSHLFALDALLEVYPDAVVVQTHRDPRKSMASMCSLAHRTAADWSTRFTPEYIGASQLDLWARGVETFDAARARHEADPASRATFLDVTHRELLDDPAGCVERVYAATGVELSDDVRAAVEAENARSLSGDRAPTHRYTLADYGLSEEAIAERFAGYRGLEG